ncbi:MAG: MerR family transcriptional regulator [bacterium]|nr:MerR family transcriptional regulator [bacterium]
MLNQELGVSTAGSLYQIGDAAQRTGLSLRTIRYYEELRLVVPSGRTSGGFRLYTDDDVERLILVRAMKPLNLSLESTREMLAARDRLAGRLAAPGEVEALVAILRRYLAAATSELARLEVRVGNARETVAHLRREIEGHSGQTQRTGAGAPDRRA